MRPPERVWISSDVDLDKGTRAAVMLILVSRYVDVALPVPLDQLFTYSVNGVEPVV
jgi:hypothetical protein